MKKSLLLLAGIIVSLIVIVSCSDQKAGVDNEPPIVRALTQSEKEVISSSNEFAFNLFSGINATHQSENVFISPFSVSTALSMTMNGAAGATLDSMQYVLGLDKMSLAEVNTSYKSLVTLLFELDKKVTIEVANSNWYKEQYTINPDFQQTLLDYYNAEVRSANFSDPATLDLINNWISVKTNGKIKDMLDQIPSDAVMYLINAIYFKANWTYQFDKSKTADGEFYISDASTVTVPMMRSEGVKLGITYTDQYHLVDIPYGNGSFSFTAVLPGWNNQDDINTMIAHFSGADLNSLLSDTVQTSIPVHMPRFKIEFKEQLNDVLKAMGMAIAFDGADFSNLFEEELELAISRVIHQSFLEVNEEGSEAAAATIVEIVETVAGPPTALYLNRPFLFFIRERNTNTILFTGKLLNPNG